MLIYLGKTQKSKDPEGSGANIILRTQEGPGNRTNTRTQKGSGKQNSTRIQKDPAFFLSTICPEGQQAGTAEECSSLNRNRCFAAIKIVIKTVLCENSNLKASDLKAGS